MASYLFHQYCGFVAASFVTMFYIYVHTGETKHLRLQGDGNCTYDQDIFTRMASDAEMNNTLDEY